MHPHRFSIPGAFLLALLFARSPAWAQEPAGEKPGAPAAEESSDARAKRRKVDLELSEAIELAILNNNGLAAEWLAARVGNARIEEARGIFDPTFDTTASWAEDRIPTGSSLGGGTVVEDSVIHWDASLGGLLPTGLTYQLTWNVDNTDTTNSFSLFNPQTRNSLDLTITQPLLRGAWTTVNRASITSARIARQMADENFNAMLADIIDQTQAAYWDLIFAIKNVAVQRANLALGGESVSITRRRYAEGLVPASDILTATAEVYRRREALINAQNIRYAAEDRLKSLIFPFLTSPEWDCAIVPLTQPRSWDEFDLPQLDSALAEAFHNRPDLESARLDVENKRLQIEVERNNLMPQLDFIGSWTSQALDNQLSDTYLNTLKGDEASYRVGLHLSIPLGNRSARARLKAAELDLQRSIENLHSLQNTIATEVRSAVRELHYLEQKWKAAIQTRRNTEEDHRAQKIKLGLGLITQFDLHDVEQNLAQARTSEFQAQTEYEKALSHMQQVQGLSFRGEKIQRIVNSSRLGMALRR